MKGLFIFVAIYIVGVAIADTNSVCPKSCDSFGITPYKGGSLFKRYYNVIASMKLLNSTRKNMTIVCKPDVGILTRNVWKQINEKVTNNSLTFGSTTDGVQYGIVRYIDEKYNSKNALPNDWRSYVSFYHIWFPKVIVLQPTVVWRFTKEGLVCEEVTNNMEDSDIYFIKLLRGKLVQ
jgi:hypothetical protein